MPRPTPVPKTSLLIIGGAEDKVGKPADQQRRVVESRHRVKFVDSERFGMLTRFDINLVERLDMLREEGYRNYEHAAHAFAGQALDCPR